MMRRILLYVLIGLLGVLAPRRADAQQVNYNVSIITNLSEVVDALIAQGAFASKTHQHSASDIVAGMLNASRYNAYDNLVLFNKIGLGDDQVASGDHEHSFSDIMGVLFDAQFNAYNNLVYHGSFGTTSNSVSRGDHVHVQYETAIFNLHGIASNLYVEISVATNMVGTEMLRALNAEAALSNKINQVAYDAEQARLVINNNLYSLGASSTSMFYEVHASVSNLASSVNNQLMLLNAAKLDKTAFSSLLTTLGKLAYMDNVAASNVVVQHSPSSYSVSNNTVEAHIVGIDDALANAGGGGSIDIGVATLNGLKGAVGITSGSNTTVNVLGQNIVVDVPHVGTGDFMADGSVPMTGMLDMNYNAIDAVSYITVMNSNHFGYVDIAPGSVNIYNSSHSIMLDPSSPTFSGFTIFEGPIDVTGGISVIGGDLWLYSGWDTGYGGNIYMNGVLNINDGSTGVGKVLKDLDGWGTAGWASEDDPLFAYWRDNIYVPGVETLNFLSGDIIIADGSNTSVRVDGSNIHIDIPNPTDNTAGWSSYDATQRINQAVLITESDWENFTGLPSGTGDCFVYHDQLYAYGWGDPAYTNMVVFSEGSWSNIASPTGYNMQASKTAVYQDNVYMMGNHGFGVTNIYRYNGTEWTLAPGLPDGRRVYYGGFDVLGDYLYWIAGVTGTNSYRFDGTNWTACAGLPTVAGYQYSETAVLGNKMYWFGGEKPGGSVTNAYMFDGTNWTACAGLPVRVHWASFQSTGDKIYSLSGIINGSLNTNSYVFDGTNWSATAGFDKPTQMAGTCYDEPYMYVLRGQTSQTNTWVKRVDGIGYYRYGYDEDVFKIDHNAWIERDCSAMTFTDRTPYPSDIAEAKRAIKSLSPVQPITTVIAVPAGKLNAATTNEYTYVTNIITSATLDHKKLDPILRNGESRNLSMTVSCLAAVVQELLEEVEKLKNKQETRE